MILGVGVIPLASAKRFWPIKKPTLKYPSSKQSYKYTFKNNVTVVPLLLTRDTEDLLPYIYVSFSFGKSSLTWPLFLRILTHHRHTKESKEGVARTNLWRTISLILWCLPSEKGIWYKNTPKLFTMNNKFTGSVNGSVLSLFICF